MPRPARKLGYRASSRVLEIAREAVPGLRIRMVVNATLARGLGSSASAIVGGIAAANMLLERPLSVDRILTEMVRMEGHPDNVAACYLGGLVVSLALENGVVYEKSEPAPNIRCVLVIPDYELSTAKARQAIPKSIPLKDAVFNIARVPFVLERLKTGSVHGLSEIMDDRLHQPFRKPLVRD